ERFKKVERRQQLHVKKIPEKRTELQFQRQEIEAARFTPSPKTPLEALNRTGLVGEQREKILREISRRGDANVTAADVQRFSANVIFGREPALEKGKYTQAGFSFDDTQPADFKPIKTTVGPDGFSIPLILPSSTATGRTLAMWQSQYRDAGYRDAVANRNGAIDFYNQTNDFRDVLRSELERSGFSEEDIELNIEGLIERELRRAELFDQAVREWQEQDSRTTLSFRPNPDDETIEKIDEQVNEVINEEFENFNKVLEYEPKSILDRAKETFEGTPVLEGVPRMAIGALEILEAISRPALSPGTPSILEPIRGEREQRIRAKSQLSIGGLPIGGTNIDEALPDLLKGFEDYFGGGVQISRPITEKLIPEEVARPISRVLKPAVVTTVRGGEEIAELFGFDARGKI
ncbi:hypothetical protein LCGC14_2817720, partial [marine sediment metagenome]